MTSPTTHTCEGCTDRCARADEVRAAERALLDYVRRYGLTDLAREVLCRSRSGVAVPFGKALEPTASAGTASAFFSRHGRAG